MITSFYVIIEATGIQARKDPWQTKDEPEVSQDLIMHLMNMRISTPTMFLDTFGRVFPSIDIERQGTD